MTARMLGFRLVSLTGLTFSSLLLADDLSRVPAFCEFSSGCAAVTNSPLGRVFGIPLSGLGVLAFLLYLGMTLVPASVVQKWLGRSALAAGAIGIALAVVQFHLLRRTCRFCLVADAAGIFLAALELGLPAREKSRPESKLRYGWLALGLGLASAPLLLSALKPPPQVPDPVRQAWVSGKTNIVEITNFSCPFCASTHAAIESLRRKYPETLHIVRVLAPAEENAEGMAMARAYHGAVRQGRGDEMANALFARGDDTPGTLRDMAARLGLDLPRFDRDLADPAIERQIHADRDWVKQQGLAGLPQTWVQDLLLFGEQNAESLEGAIRRVGKPASD